jgi:hypothetical protein
LRPTRPRGDDVADEIAANVANIYPAFSVGLATVPNVNQQPSQPVAPVRFRQIAVQGLLGQDDRLLVIVDLVEQVQRCIAGESGFSGAEKAEIFVKSG